MERTTIRLAQSMALIVGLAACATPSAPVATGTDTVRYGNLTSGEKFGAKVGQPSVEAEEVLVAQGYGFEGMVDCAADTQMLLGCQQHERYLTFQPVQNGRKGHIYLRLENGRVAQIGWMIHTVATLDG